MKRFARPRRTRRPPTWGFPPRTSRCVSTQRRTSIRARERGKPLNMGLSPRTIIAIFVAAKLALHIAYLRPYGYFRDELYYLACANHPALGYVDHPPLSIFVLGIWRAIFGDSVAAIRLVPALAGAATIFFTARLTMEL